MWDEAELPDEDVRSIYGEAAVVARSSAQFARLLKRQDEGIAFLDRLLKKYEEPQQNST